MLLFLAPASQCNDQGGALHLSTLLWVRPISLIPWTNGILKFSLESFRADDDGRKLRKDSAIHCDEIFDDENDKNVDETMR